MAAGAPFGNTNATKNRPITDLIRRSLLEDDARRARQLADKLCEMAASGDLSSIKEIMDRIDGKIPQAIEHSGPDGGPVSLLAVLKDGHAAAEE